MSNPSSKDVAAAVWQFIQNRRKIISRSGDPAFVHEASILDSLQHCVIDAERRAGETSEEADPCVSHVALKEWDRMFDAWVKYQAGLPSEVPLWPNADWSQDVAMVAHALAQQVKTGEDL